MAALLADREYFVLRRLAVSAAFAVTALAGAAHAEEWALIQSPDAPRMKMAVQTDTMARGNGQLALEFMIVHKGETASDGGQILIYVSGQQDCGDSFRSFTFKRVKFSHTAGFPILSTEEYPHDLSRTQSLWSDEREVAFLFCSGIPPAAERVEGSNSEVALMLLNWAEP